ncbi:MAG: hypothetical protein U0800_25020 [Isosphaeraceae bacterium]
MNDPELSPTEVAISGIRATGTIVWVESSPPPASALCCCLNLRSRAVTSASASAAEEGRQAGSRASSRPIQSRSSGGTSSGKGAALSVPRAVRVAISEPRSYGAWPASIR